MTITLTAAEHDAHVQYIPASDLVAGHVIYFFGQEHRVDRFLVEERGPVFDPERQPVRRIAVAVDNWSLTINPDQMVPVLAPTTLYTLEVFLSRSPREPAERVMLAAETSEQASTTARRILFLLGAAWGDIHRVDDEVYVDTVAVS